MWQSVVTVSFVYNELAGNKHVFTLDLILSTPALLLLTVFRARLSAAAGCFKVCVWCVWRRQGWETSGTFCRSTCFFGPFFFPETGLKGRKSFKWLGRSHTNVPTALRAHWASVCISWSFDLLFSAKILMGPGWKLWSCFFWRPRVVEICDAALS